MKIQRFTTNPIIYPNMDQRMGTNINGPSLIQAPDWLENPLGRYYLYFAHHDGAYIRLAYSDQLSGPWSTYEPGVLPLNTSLFAGHIASPDVYLDHEKREFRLYYHGSDTSSVEGGAQSTRVAVSNDGINFSVYPQQIGEAYMRVFQWNNDYYALSMPGIFYRSRDGLGDFEQGPTLFTSNMRHNALKLEGDSLSVFYTNVGDCPERILLSTIDLKSDWWQWQTSEPITVLEPEQDYEGADLIREPSIRGLVNEPVCQLRDPAIFCEDNRTYLLYAVAGEHGIAIAEILA